MYKHIKYEAWLSSYCDTVNVHILAQTHRRCQFGEDGAYVFKLGNVSLRSIGGPAHDPYDTYFYVCGDYPQSDDRILEMPLSDYEQFKLLVEAYNEYFKE